MALEAGEAEQRGQGSRIENTLGKIFPGQKHYVIEHIQRIRQEQHGQCSSGTAESRCVPSSPSAGACDVLDGRVDFGVHAKEHELKLLPTAAGKLGERG
jgi:hypothetical protein